MIIYTKHSKLRIEQRKIKESDIEQTVLEPDKIIESFAERKLAQKRFFDKILEVAFTTENNNLVIITAYWLREAKQ